MSDLEETMRRCHDAWAQRWKSGKLPRQHYRVTFEGGAKTLSEAAQIVSSAQISGLSVAFDGSEVPQLRIEFDCQYEVWEGLRKSFESVPCVKRWFKQSEISEKGR